MGLAEVRALLGVSRQRADQITRKPGFPAPVTRLATGKVWDADAVRAWAVGDGRVKAAPKEA
jgi:hypothetical protein